jgi:uncharacterized protein YnzC (UPF0291/DUF896 family)
MNFTIRPKGNDSTGGGMSVTAEDAREALDVVRNMLANGLKEVEILDAKGNSYDLVELERITKEGEDDAAHA